MMRKKMCLVAVMTFAFFLMIGTGYAAPIATISSNGPSQVSKVVFSFDIIVNDIGMADIEEFNLGLQIKGPGGAVFVDPQLDASLSANYIFAGNNDKYIATLVNPTDMRAGDLTASGFVSAADAMGKILASITIDASGANIGDVFTLVLYNTSWTYFGGNDGYIEYPDLDFAPGYEFTVVPIPGAALLLGSGLLGLLGIRRKMK